MNYLLTIDPGARYAAWALWDAAGLVEARQTPDSNALRVIVQNVTGPIHAYVVNVAVQPRSPGRLVHVLDGIDVLVELPQEYDDDKEERAKDLFRVAATAGALAFAFDVPGNTVKFVRPPEWKGQVPKRVHHARALTVLSAGEQSRIYSTPKVHHNVMDAVAMGLWARRRIR